MPWKCARWKSCDGGCCVRSPRFPRAMPGPDATRPAYMADCRFHLNQAGGTNPDGSSWRGGCQVMQAIYAIIAARGGVSKVRAQDITGNTTLAAVRAVTTEPKRTIDRRGGLFWFINTCFMWPLPTATQTAFRDRLVTLGLIPASDASYPLVDAAKPSYTDAERTAKGQEFHVTSDMTAPQKAAQEPACCFEWEPV